MAGRVNVYGIGNALVDIQYRVEPDYLAGMQIEKGVMTLIGEARHHELVEGLQALSSERASGGSAANTMIAVANMGGSAHYGCKVARDEFGDFYLNDLEAAGVESDSSNRGEGITGKCLVFITPDADRTMNTFLGITSAFGPDQIEEEVVSQSDYLYIEGYLLSSDTGFEAALLAQSQAHVHGTPVAITLSDPFIVSVFKERVQTILERGVNLLFCNDLEAMAYTETSKIDEACSALSRAVGFFAVTCGPKGAVIGDRDRSLEVDGFKVDAVDTNGAGDSFAGAFLFGITNGYDVGDAGKLATYVSSRVVSKYGPRIDASLKGEVDRILSL